MNATSTSADTDSDGGINWFQITLALSSVAGFAFLVMSLKTFKRTKGLVWQNHVYFAACTAFIIYVTPLKIQEFLFNPLTIVIVGSALPIYESALAVATPELADDKIWLTYWVAHGSLQYLTYWMDDIAKKDQDDMEWWFILSFFSYLWFLLPFTDGSALLFDYVIHPFLEPTVTPLVRHLEGFIAQIVTFTISSTHVWFLWAAFAFFPAVFKKFIALSFGHIYPLMASIVACITTFGEDDTQWLTYWVCFMPLLIIMEFLEQWLYKIPGFYVALLFGTAYLMVPIFDGSTKIYRNVIVPLAGLQEQLAYRDALTVKREIMKKIHEGRRDQLQTRISELFAKDVAPTESDRLL